VFAICLPPFTPVAQIDRARRRGEDERSGIEHVRQRAWIILRVGRDFSEGDVAGRLDKLSELAVCHRCSVDPKTIDRNTMGGRLFGVVLIRPHAERAAWNEHH
jgi:hypothetical protein